MCDSVGVRLLTQPQIKVDFTELKIHFKKKDICIYMTDNNVFCSREAINPHGAPDEMDPS